MADMAASGNRHGVVLMQVQFLAVRAELDDANRPGMMLSGLGKLEKLKDKLSADRNGLLEQLQGPKAAKVE